MKWKRRADDKERAAERSEEQWMGAGWMTICRSLVQSVLQMRQRNGKARYQSQSLKKLLRATCQAMLLSAATSGQNVCASKLKSETVKFPKYKWQHSRSTVLPICCFFVLSVLAFASPKLRNFRYSGCSQPKDNAIQRAQSLSDYWILTSR